MLPPPLQHDIYEDVSNRLIMNISFAVAVEPFKIKTRACTSETNLSINILNLGAGKSYVKIVAIFSASSVGTYLICNSPCDNI